MYPWCFHPDYRVHLTDRHPGGDTEEVSEPHLLHHLLPKPLHFLALGGHGRGLPGYYAVHRGVEQCALSSARTQHQRKEGRVKKGLEQTEGLFLVDCSDFIQFVFTHSVDQSKTFRHKHTALAFLLLSRNHKKQTKPATFILAYFNVLFCFFIISL